ncbi:MurT ligase domain-containing protein [Neobacillus ginsengisoli]|uniref:Lipid II isoglutaminyl synthase (glutamine-hydrolyzing) subunit MurT n=1 Tax=Neobacillus ginsengisoli TaxID=904295 RepID=A0ABT9Y199_9BACI|nr:MurT ligase domain-containing protein [Neobacillus ginsengisoli]MDQ0201605.1 UDP-N-acetylmuramyl tripeptide synthase [Neobacillus ginsengisoli]
MKTQVAIWAGKTAGSLSRVIGYGGSTIPGVVARKLDHGFLRHLRKNANTILFITGTNGKTTTANLISHLLESSGKTVIANREGSNMVTGISAAMVRNAPLIGWLKNDAAVLEVDEASLPKAVSECPPDYLIVTNFFRDQLDRYGEVDLLIKKMKDCLKEIDVKLILNADDPFTHRFSDLQKENVYIGLDANSCRFQSYAMAESKYCPNCQDELVYSVLHFGQLGHYHCPCGFERPKVTVNAEKIFQDEKGIRLIVNGEEYPTTLKGTYNAYNALFAISACQALGMPLKEIKKGMTTYQKTDGRMQEFVIGKERWKLNLVKNPTGGNVTLSEFLQSNEKKQLMFCLNDHLADGEDISWIWDIDMELANREEVETFIASGKRAYDAALRMKYAGIPEEKIRILPSLKHAVFFAKEMVVPAYIMATYTCLSPMVSILSQEARVIRKEEPNNGVTTIPFLPRHSKPVWGQRKYHMFKKALRMERNHRSGRGNQES